MTVGERTLRPVLLSSEPWDAVWRRNQHLASRVPGTAFIEQARRGVLHRWRQESGVDVLTPAKPLPLRWTVGRAVHARLLRRALLQRLGRDQAVVWVTHPLGAEVARVMEAGVVYDRTDDWPHMEKDERARALVRRLDRRLLRAANAVVIVSEAMRGQVPEGALLIPNGVDSAAFNIVVRRRRAGTLRIAFVGTLDPLRVDMEILERLARDPGVTLVLAGPGAGVAGAEQHGVIEHARIPDLLAGCDALVAPYRLDDEAIRSGDALKLYEYFA
ncbi:MAG: hypothetical protein JOY80_01645, partial [Candidatus Dormibacteraeota bacterium]|nr:hypothetical protein [Candidatus Dormibacteraeota bacterium]